VQDVNVERNNAAAQSSGAAIPGVASHTAEKLAKAQYSEQANPFDDLSISYCVGCQERKAI